MTIMNPLRALCRLLVVVPAFFLFVQPGWAQSLTLTPLKQSGTCEVGEKIGWAVEARGNQKFSSVNYTLKKNGLTVFKTDALDLSSGKATIETSLDEPGSVLLEIQLPPPSRAGLSDFARRLGRQDSRCAGNSMGGQQSISLAGLYPGITALIAEIPSSIDVTGPQHGSAAGFPDWARDAKNKNNPKILEAAQYFDPMNFASRIKVPALIAMGAYDETSPPVGVWRAINQMKGPVEPLIMNSGHQEVTVNGVNNHTPYKLRSAEWLAALVKGEAVPPK